MKKYLLIVLLSLAAVTLSAREKKFNYEFGVNYSIGTIKDGAHGFSPKVRGYFEFRHNLNTLPVDIGFQLDFSTFEREYRQDNWQLTYDYNSFNVMAVSDYRFRKGKKAEPFVGMGLGVSFGNISTGIFNEGFQTNVVVMPRVGVRLFSHLSVSADYTVTHSNYTELHLRVGFFF